MYKRDVDGKTINTAEHIHIVLRWLLEKQLKMYDLTTAGCNLILRLQIQWNMYGAEKITKWFTKKRNDNLGKILATYLMDYY
jgi:hypothetical protein